MQEERKVESMKGGVGEISNDGMVEGDGRGRQS